jgi:hypothetical protein
MPERKRRRREERGAEVRVIEYIQTPGTRDSDQPRREASMNGESGARTKLTDVMKSRGGLKFERRRALEHKCMLRVEFRR